MGRIFIWLLFFHEYDFKVVVKPGKHNAGPDHFSCILSKEEVGNQYDTLPDEKQF